jgi:hypothetical protein
MKKKYSILIDYTTGNSYSTNREQQIIELTWDNLDIAKENLQRIKGHYLYYEDHYGHSWEKTESIEKPSYVGGEYEGALSLLLDDKTEMNYYTFWCGYFEILHSATIKCNIEKNEGMSFTL